MHFDLYCATLLNAYRSMRRNIKLLAAQMNLANILLFSIFLKPLVTVCHFNPVNITPAAIPIISLVQFRQILTAFNCIFISTA